MHSTCYNTDRVWDADVNIPVTVFHLRNAARSVFAQDGHCSPEQDFSEAASGRDFQDLDDSSDGSLQFQYY